MSTWETFPPKNQAPAASQAGTAGDVQPAPEQAPAATEPAPSSPAAASGDVVAYRYVDTYEPGEPECVRYGVVVDADDTHARVAWLPDGVAELLLDDLERL